MSQHAPGGRNRHLLDPRRARAEARRVTERAGRARAVSTGHGALPLYPVATLLLLLLGAWTSLGVLILGYPFTGVGHDSALREPGAAIVLVLCAPWLRSAGFSRVAASLAALAGAGLACSARWLPHQVARIRVDESLVGALVVIVCGALAATRR